MSAPFTSVRCEKCSKNWGTHLLWGGFNYRLGPSRTMRIQKDLGWCSGCSEFSAVEVLSSRKNLESELVRRQDKLAALEDKTRSRVLSKFFPGTKHRDQQAIASARNSLQDAISGLEWRDMRRSPPRCLQCGSTDVDHVGAIGFAPAPHRIALKHPNCGGTLIVSTPPIRINIRTEDRLYDGEGRLLEVQEDLR